MNCVAYLVLLKLHARKVAAIVFWRYTAMCQLSTSDVLVNCHMQNAFFNDSHIIFSLLRWKKLYFVRTFGTIYACFFRVH